MNKHMYLERKGDDSLTGSDLDITGNSPSAAFSSEE